MASNILNIQWTSGDALKILNWTNRMLLLDLYTLASNGHQTAQQEANNTSQDEWLASGRVMPPNAGDHNWQTVVVTMRSVSAQHSDDVEVYEDWQPFASLHLPANILEHSASTIAVSLTRTRWCTKIREGLMETIKAKRIE